MNKKVLKANTFLFSLFCVYNKLRDTDKKIKTKKDKCVALPFRFAQSRACNFTIMS